MCIFPGSERWLSGTIYPMPYGPSGRKLFCYVLCDVTERKRLEQSLRDNERKLRYAANVSDSVFHCFSFTLHSSHILKVLHHVDGIVWETDSLTGEVTYINTQVRVPQINVPRYGIQTDALSFGSQKTKEILGKEVEIGKSISTQIVPLLQGTGLTVRDTGLRDLLGAVLA